MTKKRVVMAMSGGVDSSVAAALLFEQGYEVIGMTMCFNIPDIQKNKPGCCSISGIEDAQRVSHRLGIKHYVVNMQRRLQDEVIENFVQEYQSGRTPNPCVRCNEFLKFGALLQKALALDAQFLATGHYVRKIELRAKGQRPKVYSLKKGRDKFKDQSYFLYRLNQKQLAHALFPIGGYTKGEVRGLARKFNLGVADKAGSQEICFLPDNDYRSFLKARLAKRLQPGAIVDEKGNVYGQHKGIAYYTVGQRQGLGIAKGYPLYITRIDFRKNQIVVGAKEEALSREFIVSPTHSTCLALKKKVVLKVKIRYNHKEAPAEITPLHNKLRVRFKEPQFAITPGQSAVIYQQDKVVGGGIIEKALS